MNDQGQTNRDRRARDIFLRAVEIESTEARAAYVEGACQGDASLRSRVEALLKSHRQDSFLEAAAVDGPPTVTTETPLSEGPGSVIGRYKLLQKLGEGGFGVVYMAEQKEPVKRRVALKIIKLGMDTKQVVARFEAERQALAMMDHPNIAKVLDAGATETGRPYFVMELVRGIPVTKYCEQEKLDTRARLDLFINVCRAIQHAHQKGIIHRDIKPSNILVTLHDGMPVPMVIDFGIAKATQQELTEKTVFTQFQQMIGTPAYMSPEQAEMSGLDLDTRTDIYSLGVLLYELLTGSTPFDTKELMQSGLDEMRRIIREKEPVRPSTRLSQTLSASGASSSKPAIRYSSLATDLDWIVMKALEKDRTRRYETANGLAMDLQRHLNNEPVVARPPSRLYEFQKSVKRHKVGFAATAAVVAALAAGTTVSLWQAMVATQARNETLVSLRQARRLAYLADMSAVGSALENHNVGRARRLLEEYLPQPEQEDLRDFEWFHFNRLTRASESEVLGRHPGGARFLLSAPDGTFITAYRHIVFNNFAGHLLSWNGVPGSRQRLPVSLDDATALALSRDGKRLAIARGLDIEIRLRDEPEVVETALTNWHEDIHLSKPIATMIFCDQDKRLAVSCVRRLQPRSGASLDAPPVMLVEIAADRAVQVALTKPPARILALAASEDGQLLALSEGGNDVVVLRLPEGVEAYRFAQPYDEQESRGLRPLMFVNQDRNLVTTSEAGQVDLWETVDWHHVRTLEGHASSVTALATSPDGRFLASAGLDQLVKVWDLGSNEEVPSQTLRGHGDEVWGVAFLPDGHSLVSCGRDESVRLWDLQRQASEQMHWPLPAGTVDARLGRDFVSLGNAKRKYALWDVARTEESVAPQPIVPPRLSEDELLVPLPGAVFWLALPNPVVETRPDWGYPLALYRAGKTVEPVAAFPEFGLSQQGWIHCNGSRLILHGAIGGEPHVLVWDLDQERTVQLFRTNMGGNVTVAVSPDESLVVLGNARDSRLETVDLATGSSTVHRVDRLTSIYALAVLPGNRFALAGGQPGLLCKINLTTGKASDSVSASLLGIHTMSLSPGGTRLATGDAQGKVKLWDVETLREVAVLGTHPGIVTSVRFQPDGRSLLSVDTRELRIWRAGMDL